jgi:hypothetical protein
MPSSRDSRYEEIRRRIAQRGRDSAHPAQPAPLADALDALNALGFLEDLARQRLSQINLYGPSVFQSKLNADLPWMGAVVWYKPRGYYHFQTLTLLGIWAYPAGDALQITLGVKTLDFAGPIFNPESLYHHLKHGFDLYYTGDASPPPEAGRCYTALYDLDERLGQRTRLQAELARWAEGYR